MDKAAKMAMYFPRLQFGHGSTHRYITDDVTPGHEHEIIGERCVYKGCIGKDHHSNSIIQAEEWLKNNGCDE